MISSLSIFTGYYALTTEKKFTARSIFKIEEKKGSQFNVSSDLGALASLVGFAGSQTSSTKTLLERLEGREFILGVSKKLLLDSDPSFNSYDPDFKDPFWKSTIKKIIGWQTTQANKDAIIENSIIGNFKENIDFQVTDGGAIAITVVHINPQKASDYTNKLMEEIRLLVKDESLATRSSSQLSIRNFS